MFMHAITLGLNYVGSEHDTDSQWTNTYPLQFLTEVLKQNPHFSHNDLSLSIKITFQQ